MAAVLKTVSTVYVSLNKSHLGEKYISEVSHLPVQLHLTAISGIERNGKRMANFALLNF